jgi:hypothetical protein
MSGRRHQKDFIEDNIRDNPPGVGLEISDADTMLAYLKNLEGH